MLNEHRERKFMQMRVKRKKFKSKENVLHFITKIYAKLYSSVINLKNGLPESE